MSLVFFVMAHHKPRQLEALLRVIGAKGDNILLHIDAKSALGLRTEGIGVLRQAFRITKEMPNIKLLRPRFTNWGGWSLSALHLTAIDVALRVDSKWTHFLNLSGQCYPLKSITKIREEVGRLGDMPLVERIDFGALPASDWHQRWRSMIETPVKAFPLPWRLPPPRSFELRHKGSQWSVLPRAFCEWQASAPIRRHIRRYLRHLHLTDELVIQAILDNSPWANCAFSGNGHEILWPGHTIEASDIPRLAKSQAWFTRKVDFEQDPTVAQWFQHRVSERISQKE